LKQTNFSTLAIAALIILVLIARALPGPRTIDDAFITFRYSRNIVEGQGFVYNPGVHTLGTTTPLFTLIMAGISFITGGQDFQWYAIAVSAIADAITCILLFLLARRITENMALAFVFGALWAISPRSVTFAVGGMETSVNILWMVAAIWLFVSEKPANHKHTENTENEESRPLTPTYFYRDKQLWIGVFAALGVLTRIDAVLWIAPLFLYQWLERIMTTRRSVRALREAPLQMRLWAYFPLRTWIAFVVVLAPWLIFSTFYFGSPLPNSLSAKSLAYTTPPGSAFLTLALGTYTVPFFETQVFPAELRAIAGFAFIAIYLALSLLGFLYIARRERRLLAWLIYPWLYLVAFSIANPLIFRWYVLPPMPALTLGIIAGLWGIVRGVNSRYFTAAVVTVISLFWIIDSLNVWTLHPDHGLDRPAPQMAWHQIELYYQQMAEQMVAEYGVTSETRVASADIGAIGYFTRAIIVDTVGLVTPELRFYYPVSPELIVEGQNYAIPPLLISDTQPDFLVTMEAFVRLGLAQTPEFTAQYMLIEAILTDFYGTGMLLYQRHAETQP
jgi:hypothetical protein